jgi:hypothetical protein
MAWSFFAVARTAQLGIGLRTFSSQSRDLLFASESNGYAEVRISESENLCADAAVLIGIGPPQRLTVEERVRVSRQPGVAHVMHMNTARSAQILTATFFSIGKPA